MFGELNISNLIISTILIINQSNFRYGENTFIENWRDIEFIVCDMENNNLQIIHK